MLEYAAIVDELEGCVMARKSGTFFVSTSDQHSIRIALRDGEVVSLAYRSTRGAAAIPLISAIRSGSVRFDATSIFPASKNEDVPSAITLIARLRARS